MSTSREAPDTPDAGTPTDAPGGRSTVSAGTPTRAAASAGGAAISTVSVSGALGAALAAHDDRLSHCVHCGFCLPACPTYTRLGDEADSPRGRLHLMGAVIEGRLDPASDAFQRHMDRCLGCRACETVCPSGVEYGFLLERAREVAVAARRPAPAQRLLLGAIERPWVLRIWMFASRLLRRSGVPALAARLLPPDGALGTPALASAMLAASSPAAALRADGGTQLVAPPAPGASGSLAAPGLPSPRAKPLRVGVLRGCVQDGLFRRVNEATRRVLAANGFEVVEVEGQGCCGALHAHGGRLDRARAMARVNAGAFRAAAVDHVAMNAAGCGAAVREYPHLLDEGSPGDQELARWISGRSADITELLAGNGASGPAGPLRIGAPVALRVAYDPPCHLLHAQRVAEPPLALLRSIPELEVVEVPNGDECCGGAGIYGITHPELGGRIGGDKARAVVSTGADLLATGNPGCAMQIGAALLLAGSSMRVVHPVELLDESYRRAGVYEEKSNRTVSKGDSR